MLKQLKIENFTAFKKVDLTFCDGLNVLVGENGTGKTHLLKMGYLVSTPELTWTGSLQNQSKELLAAQLEQRLCNLYKPDRTGGLVGNAASGKATLSGSLSQPDLSEATIDLSPDFLFSFYEQEEASLAIERFMPTAAAIGHKNVPFVDAGSVYMPSKEILSFFEGFVALYKKRELSFDETYHDLALKLSTPKLKQPPRVLNDTLQALGKAVGGEVLLDGGRFYIVGEKNVEMHRSRLEATLLAEGLRKLATLMQLIANGSLQAGGTLFWDEPEANLNPRLMKLTASAILQLCSSGIQVVLATHSLFLLRELEIQGTQKKFSEIDTRYFALKLTAKKGVSVRQGRSVDDIDPIVLLDESLNQSDRFMSSGDKR